MTVAVSEGLADLHPSGLDVFARFVESTTGIRVPPSKYLMLQGRLRSRMRALNVVSLESYRRLVFESPAGEAEKIHLLDAVTTNKTDFFRESRQFEFLVARSLPALLERRRSRTRLNVWCAGCSTGEEAYTLAMVLAEQQRRYRDLSYSILATDLSTRVLAHARRAIYPRERALPIPQAYQHKYLLQSKDPRKALIRIAPALRKTVTFHRLNFMDTRYQLKDRYDIVFFRNVAIYFSQATQKDVVGRILAHLDRGGFFFTGLSESLGHGDPALVPVAPSIYRHGQASEA